jgi:hypothetical protein
LEIKVISLALGRSIAAAMPPHIKAQCHPLTRVLKKRVKKRLVVTIIP